MSGEMEAAGAMANAGLVAGAIEGREPHKAGEGPCANCGAAVAGKFCANCGQPTHTHRSLWHLAEELLHGVFHFDTKIWRTVPMLLVRPGTLTRNYVFGKRARYVSPLAMFLLCIFLLFFAVSLIPPPNVGDIQSDDTPHEQTQNARDHLKEAQDGLREAQAALRELHQELGTAAPSREQRLGQAAAERAVSLAQANVERRQAALARAEERERAQQQRQQEAAAAGSAPVTTTTTAAATPTTAPPSPPPIPAPTTPSQSAEAHIDETPAPPTASSAAAADQADLPNPYPEGSLDAQLYKLSQSDFDTDGNSVLAERVRQKLRNPPLFIYKLQETASKFSFLLVPITLPLIAFLFMFKRGVTLYDHTVFALYSLSFASLLCVLVIAASPVSWLRWVPGVAIMIGFPIHMFFHLGGAYGLKWWSALWRTVFMLTFCTVALVAFILLILYIGVAGS